MKNWANNDPVNLDDAAELVTSANLNFATTAARDSFLTGPYAPVPGTVTYQQNDGLVYRRITVAGVDYWAPEPGTFLVLASLSPTGSSQTLPLNGAGVATQVLMGYTRGRNFGNWWTNNMFAPKVPGFYELSGGVTFAETNYYDGYRAAWLSLNGASIATAIPGSWNQLYPGATNVTLISVPFRTVCRYFDGVSGYVTVMAMHGSTTAHNLVANNQNMYDCTFMAKYLGM